MAVQDQYLSLAGTSEGLYKEKGSKFIAYAFPVENEADISEHLEALRKQYYDARHHCYAYLLKPEEGREETYRANDDGEPAHSAGDPILGQIRSHQLLDAMVVVIRYFGGTKLGVSGLIHAYKTAAAEAIGRGKIIEKTIRRPLSIRFSYAATHEVMQLLDQYDIQIDRQEFAADCFYRLLVARSQWAQVREKLQQTAGVEII